MPPAPGMTPIRISGWPKVASSAATIMSQVIASSQPPPSANPRTAAISGRPIAAIRSQASNRPPVASDAAICVRQLADVGTGRERPGAGAGDDDGPARRVGVERLERGGQRVEQVEAEGVERLGPIDRHEGDAGERGRGAADAGAGAGTATCTSSRAVRAARLGGASRCAGRLVTDDPRVRPDSIHGSGSRGIHFRRVLEHEQRGQARGDLAQDPAGGPHRVRAEAGVERRPVVEVASR